MEDMTCKQLPADPANQLTITSDENGSARYWRHKARFFNSSLK